MNTTCSICIEDLDGINNRLTTDCGHCFHTNCFLQNVSHNGFNCPNCRNQLIEEPELDSEDEDEDDYDSEDEDDEESVDDSSVSVAGPGLEAHMLRGFRWLFQRVEDEDDDDDSDDDSDDSDDEYEQDPLFYQRGHEDYNESHYPTTSIQEISERIRLSGMTFVDLVALTVFPHKDHAEDMNTYHHVALIDMRKKIQKILDGETEPVVEFTDEELDAKTPIVIDLTNEPIIPSVMFVDLTDEVEFCRRCETIEIADCNKNICDACYQKERFCRICLETETNFNAICIDCWLMCDEL